jgi:allantoinase
LYREGEKSPKMMTVALHARISGHPGSAEVVHRFLDYLAGFADIWICTRQQIAQHWYQHHPFTPTGN